MPPSRTARRRICFITGTRAELGLMLPTLRAIQHHPRLQLQLIATGMHLSRRHGNTIQGIKDHDLPVTDTVPWNQHNDTPAAVAYATGTATARFASVFAQLKPDIVLLVGDRVEPFAAASAAHLSHLPIAHVHGGDRAIGQVDDALRHAITKLSHLHFPATRASAQRIKQLGEDAWRIRPVGSPGIDGIRRSATPWPQILRTIAPIQKRRYALLILHPESPNAPAERSHARELLRSTLATNFEQILIVYPNNDPGSAAIMDLWHATEHKATSHRLQFFPNLSRPDFLALLANAAVLIGNSSSGIIEAASFGTPVINVGSRQLGRERSANVLDVPFGRRAISLALSRIWNNGHPKRFPARNVYGGASTSKKIANTLAQITLDDRLLRKLIAY